MARAVKIEMNAKGAFETYCNRDECGYFGHGRFNTRAYCQLYEKWLAGSWLYGEKKVKTCLECKKNSVKERDGNE